MKKYILLVIFFVEISLSAQTTQLTVRGFSEGFYRASTGRMIAVCAPMNYPNLCDTGFIQVIDTTSGQPVFCTDVLIKTDGYGYCDVPAYLTGDYYRVSIKFKNTFHLMSKNLVRMTGNAIIVDLTIPQNVCCGFDSAGGVAKAYSGDLNNDGAIDGSDFLILDPDISAHLTGYAITDLNGDHVVDSTGDYTIIDRNISSGRWEAFVGVCDVNGIKANEEKQFNIFPNPFQNHLNIRMYGYLPVRYVMTDIAGRICKEGFDTTSDVRIETEDLNPGVYVLKFFSNDQILYRSVVLKTVE
jgi:hypothetical protein